MRREIATGWVKIEESASRAEGDPLVLSGYAAVYDKIAIFRGQPEVILPGAFSRAMTRVADKSLALIGTIEHDARNTLAGTLDGTLEVKEDEVGLHSKMYLDPKDPEHVRAYNDVRRGYRNGMSFFFDPDDYKEKFSRGVRQFVDLLPFEVTLARNPVYKEARAETARSGGIDYDVDAFMKKYRKEQALLESRAIRALHYDTVSKAGR